MPVETASPEIQVAALAAHADGPRTSHGQTAHFAVANPGASTIRSITPTASGLAQAGRPGRAVANLVSDATDKAGDTNEDAVPSGGTAGAVDAIGTASDADDVLRGAAGTAGNTVDAGALAASTATTATTLAPPGATLGRRAAPLTPAPHRKDVKAGEINERAKWWLAGIIATLLVLLVAGRRKRRAQKVKKMDKHRTEPGGPNLRPPSLLKPPAREPRVRMFSAHGIYAPTHAAHRAPWEAPVETAGGFAHCYELGAEVADDLLFVPGAEMESAWMPVPSSPVSQAAHPVAVASTMTMRSKHAIGALEGSVEMVAGDSVEQETAESATPPLVFPIESAPQFQPSQVEPPVGTHESAVLLAMPEPAMDAIETIIAIERDPPQTSGSSMQPGAPAVPLAERRIAPAVELPLAEMRATGVTMFAPAELALLSSTTPVSALEAPMAAPPPVQAPAPLPVTLPRDPLVEARKLVDAGDYAGALVHLDEVLRLARPPTDAWVMSAMCWWQIARADGGSQAYANAADAMERLLERDPSQLDIWYRSGSCRLLQASTEHGTAKRTTLDLAISALRRAVPEAGKRDPLRVATLGDALFERALASTDETSASRALRMSEAVHVLRDAVRLARDPASKASWTLQQALQSQANLLSNTDASRMRLEADAVLAAGVESTTGQQRLSWYAAKVQNELAHAELAEGATRTLHLRTFREHHRDVLTGPDAAPELLLSWLELLALETGHLRGDAARARFDEGEAILKRLDALLPRNAHVALARARLLRRRAAQANAVSRPAALSEAIAGLMPLVEHGDAPQLQIELAEVMLDRAACIPLAQAHGEYARAEAMASNLLQHPVFAMAAARCIVQARLGQSPDAIDPAVCSRLETLAGSDARSRWLLAQAAMRNGEPREACGHCEAAAKNGVRLDQAMVQLWDRASRQWSAMLRGQKDAAWLANKQSLRSAS
jgi:hypothetical protein